MRWICALLMSARVFCDMAVPAVQEGQLWTSAVKADVPKEAYPALQNYLSTLIASRPLPWPYYLEKTFVADGTITVQGRLLRPGTYCLPLGVFFWHGASYVLPSLAHTSSPIRVSQLSANDMLLPYPSVALFQTPNNKRLLLALLQKNRDLGYAILSWQGCLRHALALFGLLLICSPIVVQAWRWWRLKKPATTPVPSPTIADALQEVMALRREGKTPWPQLVSVLNKAASTTSLTTLELEQRFSSEGRTALAQAAASIEERGYKPDNEQYFNEAARLIEEGLRAEGS